MSSDQLESDPEGDVGRADVVSDCEAAVEQLYAFLDGELTESLRLAFIQHLDACGPCVEVVTFESELRRVIADRCQDHVPDELIERISAAIEQERRPTD